MSNQHTGPHSILTELDRCLFEEFDTQSIMQRFPGEDACMLMRDVLAREGDPNMAIFLEELIRENCGE